MASRSVTNQMAWGLAPLGWKLLFRVIYLLAREWTPSLFRLISALEKLRTTTVEQFPGPKGRIPMLNEVVRQQTPLGQVLDDIRALVGPCPGLLGKLA